MTEQTTTDRTEVKRCRMGSATNSPCPFPATAPVSRHSLEEPRLCAYHAATEPLVEEETDLNMALDLIAEWQKVADEQANRPLHDLLLRARQEFQQRLALVEGVLEDLHAADVRLFRK